ncbi:hypothetical protein N7539_006365 [Penicillium diatomitis]|uniref:Ribosomal protein/NADH dehydrogenase domain-containing protein n=1 Tax=Penicillium diatomitis TaxID=2819901 RepID=A0A9X0BT98_9EURO|nr:uncharacterized protein N7539_006365 [Penicillium diatomitis]KAJ5482919.1 hypothetical protein N7539_006365 [Penicillium diatomitis]
MVNLFKRMRKLKTILDIRTGLGAAIFPNPTSATKEFPPVTRLHLTYARKIYNGHQGARHFWRNCLPRLKYHNPAVRMTVQQTEDQSLTPSLTIYFAERLSSTAPAIIGSKKISDKHAPAPESSEKIAVVDLKDLTYKEIWSRVQAATGAEEVRTSAEDEAERKRLDAITAKAGKDRERIQAIRQAKKDQERMLAEARGEVEKMKEL